ncbi:hypothetical protein [Microbacterium sp. bgisy189]|uniref:hypothetical protein n=1 Tax=Microbacterium sp. bgisy189 TaxID=3413798 RepID=UPI003EBA9AAC
MATAAVFSLGAAPRVNLMPRAETARRERASLIRRWMWGIVSALLVVALAAAGTFFLQVTAAMRLAEENARTNALLTQVAALTDVRAKLDLEGELADFRTAAMGTDLTWAQLLATVDNALPEDVSVTGFSLAPGGLAQGDDPALEVGATGTLTLSSASPAEIVPLVRELRGIESVLEVDGWQSTADDESYEYELRISFDQSVYTGAYAAEVTE